MSATIFQIFRDAILNHATLTNAPIHPTDIVNKQYVDNLPYVIGPAVSVPTQVPTYGNATGNLFVASPVTIDSMGNVNNVKNINILGTTTFNDDVQIITGKYITLNSLPSAPNDAVNKQYVDTQISTNTINYQGGPPTIATSLVRWFDASNQVITKSVATLTDLGLLSSPTINSVSGYQVGSALYLSGVGGTPAAPNVLTVGNTGYINPSSTAGVNNIFMGTAVGNAGLTQSGTADNIAIGNGILSLPLSVSNPIGNVFIGNAMADAVISAEYNVIIGYESGKELLSGIGNVLIGKSSGRDITGSGVSGANNVCVGLEAGKFVDSGSNNVFLGTQVGCNLSTSFSPPYPPYSPNLQNTAGSTNVCIGFHADTNNHSNVIVLGTNARSAYPNCLTVSSSITKWNSIGLSGTIGGANMMFDPATGDIGYIPSSLRYKDNVGELRVDSSNIYKLAPKSFTWKSNGTPDWGLIAEETMEIMPELVALNVYGLPETVKYQNLPVLLLAEMKKLKEENRRLENMLTTQEKMLIRLEKRLADLESPV